jgi:hypothetical protein
LLRIKPTISGQISGKVGQNYQYTFKSTDPDGDQVYYYVEWGDGDIVDWDGPHDSGVEVAFSHTWNTPGDYQITCKAKDPYEAESDLVTLKVTMPRNRAMNNLFFNLFEKFPLLREVLLRLINL